VPAALTAHAWAHAGFESLAYLIGFALYRRQRGHSGDFLSSSQRGSLIVAAVLGAALGSKVLGWFEEPAQFARHWRDPYWLIGGKTIVGGLLGGTLAVEWTKHRLGIVRRTGDLFTIPIVVGMIIGRLGCFFGGLPDHTYGNPTSLPWGVDFGDGVLRHPAQLYEIAFLATVVVLLRWVSLRREGDLFRVFLFSYCAFRFVIEFIKPDPPLGPLSAIQWVCLAAGVWYSRDMFAIVSGDRG
jgi:phosphatidylglycerol---prolipoprotein diacylglyceryl transferase